MTRSSAVVLELGKHLALICGFKVVQVDVILVVPYLVLKLVDARFLVD